MDSREQRLTCPQLQALITDRRPPKQGSDSLAHTTNGDRYVIEQLANLLSLSVSDRRNSIRTSLIRATHIYHAVYRLDIDANILVQRH